MTGGDAFKQKLMAEDALSAAIDAYLADPSAFVAIEVGTGQINVAAAVLAHAWSAEELAVEGASPARRRNAVKTAVLLACAWGAVVSPR